MNLSRFTRAPIAALALSMGLAAFPASAHVVPKNDAEAAVVGLLDTAFNQKKPAEAFETFGGAYYTQHNPTAPAGKEAVVSLLSGWLPTVPQLHYDIKRIVSDGDMVWVHSHVTTGPDDRGMAVVDIFRLEGGKVVEHWDVGTAVPESALNDNTMF